METSILTPTQKYAAAALFAIALNQSQIHQNRPWNPLTPLHEEPIGEGMNVSETSSVSNYPHLWIHENSGLLLPIFGSLGVDDHTWGGLKETAGSSSQVRHHVAAFLTLLSEEDDETCSERRDKEIALTKTVDATTHGMEDSSSSEEVGRSQEHSFKCIENDVTNEMHATSSNTTEPLEVKQMIHLKFSNKEKPLNEFLKKSEVTMKEAKLLSYPRKVTVLYELLEACVNDEDENKKYVKQRKGYDARHRTALRLLATWLSIQWVEMEAMEIMVSTVIALDNKEREKNSKSQLSESPWEKLKRAGIIGTAALTGGTLMAVTGGLATPAIMGGLGIWAPSLGTVGSIAVAASFGAAGVGLTGTKMARRVGSLEEFEFKEIGDKQKKGLLAVGIMVSGLILEDEDFITPWTNINDNLERCALQWESKVLVDLTTAIQDWLKTKIAMEWMKQGAMLAVISTLIAGLAIPATLVSAANLIDTKWSIALDRSDKTGKVLAETLLEGLHGNRPVTLFGFSLGARVVFKCLQCLMKIGNNAGLIEKVVLLGAPLSIKDENWEDVRKMVSGRFVNVYATNDWTLGVLFRTSLLSQGLAGIQPIDISGIENIDITDLFDGHSSYMRLTKQILEQLELENYFPVSMTTTTQSHDVK